MDTQPVVDFLNRVIAALGISASVEVEVTPDGPRLNLVGDEAELLVRHRGEPLKALQHVVDSSYGRGLEGDKRVFVDALEYRKGKDIELRQMAKFLAQKAKDSGLDQQLGPLNPYERRIVHIALSEVEGVATRSVGDGFLKRIAIYPTRKSGPGAGRPEA
jgi:spoIIIJ-associated protein